MPPIAGGLSEGTSEARQPRGTYIDGENVRGVCPRSGKLVWGAQRAGLGRLGGAAGSDATPSLLFEAERVILRERWVDLTTSSAANTSPDEVGVAWSLDLQQGQVLDMVTSLEGLAYYLLDSGEVVVVNDAQRISERVPSVTPAGFRTVPRLGVDADGALFVAATVDTASTATEGVASLLVRLEKSDVDVWSDVWVAEFSERMATFAYGEGNLYLVLDPPEPEAGDRPPASLVRMAAPLSTNAVAWSVFPIPRPVMDVAIGRGGSALLSMPSSQLRFAVDGTAFTVRSVTWTPFNLAAAEAQLHAWISADAVNDSDNAPEDGDPVSVMNDRRQRANPFVEIGEPVRDVRSTFGSFFEAPTWDASAFGGLGGVKFAPQALLRSGRNTSTEAERELALIPSEVGVGFGWAMAVQLDAASIAAATVRSLLSQPTTDAGQASWLLASNGDQLTVLDETSPVSTGVADVGTESPGGSRAAIISMHVTAAGAVPVWRINGTTVASATVFPLVESFGPYDVAGLAGATVDGPATMLGEGNANEVNLLAAPGVSLAVQSQLGDQSPSRLVDGTITTRLQFDSRPADLVYATVTADFGSVITGIDSLQLYTSASSVRVQIGTGAPTGTPPVVGGSAFDQTFSLFEIAPRREYGDGVFGYDLRLPKSIPIAGRYVVLTFNATFAGESAALWVSEVSLRAQGLNGAKVPDTWWLYEAVSLKTGTLANLQAVEAYLARKVGLLHELDPAHPYFASMPAVVGEIVDPGGVRETLLSPYPILVKYSSGGDPIAAVSSAGLGIAAIAAGDHVLTWGEPDPYGDGAAPAVGTIARKLLDNGRTFTAVWSASASGADPIVAPTRIATGPCGSLFVPYRPKAGASGSAGVRRYLGSTGALSWQLPYGTLPLAVGVGGLQIDESALGGACGPEFLFMATAGGPRAHRVDVTGRLDTGLADRVEVSRFSVLSSGSLVRYAGEGDPWSVVASGVFGGDRPWAQSIYGKTIIGDSRTYRVWDPVNETLRDFSGSVKGYLPPRAKLALAHRGRLYLAAADNPFALYASRYGDVFDWSLDPLIDDVSTAIAGTTAAQGRVPERITALMPLADDVLLVGTARAVYAITGDLGEGGRLDLVDPSHGVSFGYAWCSGSRGLYYFSSRGGLWLRSAQGGRLVSEGRVQRRLEDIDQTRYRIELAYRWQDRTVHVFVVPLSGFESDLSHFVLEEETGAFHRDRFAGGVARQVTSVATFRGATSSEGTLAMGFGDGFVREFQAAAEDDDGVAIGSHALVGPLVSADDAREGSIRAVYGQLASDGGGVQVGVRSSDVADVPGALGETGILDPGRGYGVTVRGAGAALYVDVRGIGRAWSVHEMMMDATVMGEKRNRR